MKGKRTFLGWAVMGSLLLGLAACNNSSTSTPPPPTQNTLVALEGVYLGNTNNPVNPSNVSGINTVRAKVVLGQQTPKKIQFLIDNQVGYEVAIGSSSSGVKAQNTLTFEWNLDTRALNNFTPLYPNGPHTLSVRLLDASGGTIATSSSAQLTFNNQDFIVLQLDNFDDQTNVHTAGGTRYFGGNPNPLVVRAIPVVYTGRQVQQVSLAGAANSGPDNTAPYEFTLTYTPNNPAAPLNGGGASDFDTDNGPGGISVTVAFSDASSISTAGDTTNCSPSRLGAIFQKNTPVVDRTDCFNNTNAPAANLFTPTPPFTADNLRVDYAAPLMDAGDFRFQRTYEEYPGQYQSNANNQDRVNKDTKLFYDDLNSDGGGANLDDPPPYGADAAVNDGSGAGLNPTSYTVVLQDTFNRQITYSNAQGKRLSDSDPGSNAILPGYANPLTVVRAEIADRVNNRRVVSAGLPTLQYNDNTALPNTNKVLAIENVIAQALDNAGNPVGPANLLASGTRIGVTFNLVGLVGSPGANGGHYGGNGPVGGLYLIEDNGKRFRISACNGGGNTGAPATGLTCGSPGDPGPDLLPAPFFGPGPTYTLSLALIFYDVHGNEVRYDLTPMSVTKSDPGNDTPNLVSLVPSGSLTSRLNPPAAGLQATAIDNIPTNGQVAFQFYREHGNLPGLFVDGDFRLANPGGAPPNQTYTATLPDFLNGHQYYQPGTYNVAAIAVNGAGPGNSNGANLRLAGLTVQ